MYAYPGSSQAIMGRYLGLTQFLLNFYSDPTQFLIRPWQPLPRPSLRGLFPKGLTVAPNPKKNAHRQLFEDLFPWAAR